MELSKSVILSGYISRLIKTYVADVIPFARVSNYSVAIIFNYSKTRFLRF